MDRTDDHLPAAPANDNDNPLRRPEFALEHMYRLRRELLAADTTGRPLSRWRERRKALDEIEVIARHCLDCL